MEVTVTTLSQNISIHLHLFFEAPILPVVPISLTPKQHTLYSAISSSNPQPAPDKPISFAFISNYHRPNAALIENDQRLPICFAPQSHLMMFDVL